MLNPINTTHTLHFKTTGASRAVGTTLNLRHYHWIVKIRYVHLELRQLYLGIVGASMKNVWAEFKILNFLSLNDSRLFAVTVGSSGLPSEVASISLSVSSFDVANWEDLNLCEYLGGAGCPDAGTYSISEYSINLPDPSSSLSLAGSMGMSVSVGADIYFDNGDFEQCIFSIALVNQNSGYSMAYIGMAGFMLFGVGTTLGVKRRKVKTIQLDDAEDTHNHFELMPNEHRRALV